MKLEFDKDAKEVINTITELAKRDTEDSLEEMDNILEQYEKYDLVTIITAINPAIPRKRYTNKSSSQVIADIVLLIAMEVEEMQIF